MKWWGPFVLVLVTACATTPLEDAALRRDWARLETQIVQAQQTNGLSNGRVSDLARAVLRGEIKAARDREGVERIWSLRRCAPEIEGDLEDRADGSDAVAATAQRLLIELDDVSLGREIDRYASSEDPDFRALAARSAISEKSARQRRAWIKDGDSIVRRAALEAAGLAKSAGDVPDLLEAARLDPDALNRSLAARAATATGSVQAILALRDYWPRAAAGDRLTYVEAWSSSSAFSAGGERELAWVVATAEGEAAIAAAATLLRSGTEESRTLGRAALSRALENGTPRERRLAIRLAPLGDESLLPVIEKVAQDPVVDEHSVAAWQRLFGLATLKDRAGNELRKLAQGKVVPVAARHALAELGEGWVAPLLRADLQANRAAHGTTDERLRLAEDLVRVGDYSTPAIVLADGDAGVRSKLACFVLAAKAGRDE